MVSEEQINNIAERAAKKAVAQYITQMGLDISKSEAIELQADKFFIRRFRNTCEQAGSRIVMTVIGVLTLATLGGIILAVRKAMGF